MRVMIAEDAALLREGLRRLLEDEGHTVLAAVADGEALLDAVRQDQPDVAIIDVRMPPSFTDEGLTIPSGEVLPYRVPMPHVNHTFLPGHRLMVQIQSSWFPLYDRNPQTFVDNIAWAEPGDYRSATHRIHHTEEAASFIELPVRPPSEWT